MGIPVAAILPMTASALQALHRWKSSRALNVPSLKALKMFSLKEFGSFIDLRQSPHPALVLDLLNDRAGGEGVVLSWTTHLTDLSKLSGSECQFTN